MPEQTPAPPLSDTPADFQVAKVEHVKTKDDGAHIVKLGLVASNGWKGWAECFCKKAEDIPAEGKTAKLGLKDDPKWGLKAWLPRKGGGGGGGFKGRPADPKAEAYKQTAIIHQHSQTLALEVLRVIKTDFAGGVDAYLEELNRVACKLTLQVQEVGEEARRSA